jgi:hypothetical protein
MQMVAYEYVPKYLDFIFRRKSAGGILGERYSRGIPQSKAYRRLQQLISVPFPCRSGKQTYRLAHVTNNVIDYLT